MAVATEKTVEEKMRELYLLQQIDSKIDEIEILKGELPMEKPWDTHFPMWYMRHRDRKLKERLQREKEEKIQLLYQMLKRPIKNSSLF